MFYVNLDCVSLWSCLLICLLILLVVGVGEVYINVVYDNLESGDVILSLNYDYEDL